MGQKPTALITGISGNLGLRLLRQLPDYNVIGLDIRPPEDASALAQFEKVDLAEERSCDQILELMRSYRPEAVVHLAFVVDPLRTGVVDKKRMWQINVAGTSRVTEAIAEHNRMLGGIDKFIFPSSAMVYGPELSKPATEDSSLSAQSLPYALHQQEADRTVQSRARGMKCKTYILRPHVYAGATVQNYQLGVLRGIPGGKGRLGERLRRQGKRLPLWLPSRGDYLEHKFQFVHVDDVARLIAHILRRKLVDPKLTILNVAGRGEPLELRRCVEVSGIEVQRVPGGRTICRQALRVLWDLGVSDIPPEALPYLLGSSTMDTARLRVFLGEHYRTVIEHTCEDALADSFSKAGEQVSMANQKS
jgi:UDP-glucose 4-epimerase